MVVFVLQSFWEIRKITNSTEVIMTTGYGVSPPLLSMWYCLVERLGKILESPDALLPIMPDVTQAFHDFRGRNGFAPNPEQLVRIVLGLEPSVKRLRGARVDEDLDNMADPECLAPAGLVHMLCRLRQDQRTALSEDNILKANFLKSEILRTKTKLEDHAKELCTICYVEKPTARFSRICPSATCEIWCCAATLCSS